jgi:hypothetical protein
MGIVTPLLRAAKLFLFVAAVPVWFAICAELLLLIYQIGLEALGDQFQALAYQLGNDWRFWVVIAWMLTNVLGCWVLFRHGQRWLWRRTKEMTV